ncbi:MAG: FAD-binding oxidoreductase [Gemmatimonadaceae bacterium]|nr:FAD-binding oxidoreductase [Gemmatimonadaceae bacterium]
MSRALTPHRRLRRGRSIWYGTVASDVRTEELPRVQVADVVVVGAGISGALCALELARDGHQVIVLDRRTPTTGSTLASTAIIQFEIDQPITRLADQIGWARAARAWQCSWNAVQSLQHLVAREHVRCGMKPRRSLYLAGDAMDARELAREFRARQRAGLHGELVDRDRLQRHFGIDRDGAILSRGSASANPVQLTAGLLRRVQQCGARIYASANVQHVSASRGGVWLEVENDRAVLANHVVFCTGYELLHDIPKPSHEIISTWAVAGDLLGAPPRWLRNTVVWEAADPYLYLRLHGNQLIAGGRDERHPTRYSARDTLAPKRARIADDVHTLLPTLDFKTTHVWAGAFGNSPTALPIIDRVPGIPRGWFVAALGGNGITYSMIAAGIIRRAVRGERDPNARLFRLQ